MEKQNIDIDKLFADKLKDYKPSDVQMDWALFEQNIVVEKLTLIQKLQNIINFSQISSNIFVSVGAFVAITTTVLIFAISSPKESIDSQINKFQNTEIEKHFATEILISENTEKDSANIALQSDNNNVTNNNSKKIAATQNRDNNSNSSINNSELAENEENINTSTTITIENETSLTENISQNFEISENNYIPNNEVVRNNISEKKQYLVKENNFKNENFRNIHVENSFVKTSNSNEKQTITTEIQISIEERKSKSRFVHTNEIPENANFKNSAFNNNSIIQNDSTLAIEKTVFSENVDFGIATNLNKFYPESVWNVIVTTETENICATKDSVAILPFQNAINMKNAKVLPVVVRKKLSDFSLELIAGGGSYKGSFVGDNTQASVMQRTLIPVAVSSVGIAAKYRYQNFTFSGGANLYNFYENFEKHITELSISDESFYHHFSFQQLVNDTIDEYYTVQGNDTTYHYVIENVWQDFEDSTYIEILDTTKNISTQTTRNQYTYLEIPFATGWQINRNNMIYAIEIGGSAGLFLNSHGLFSEDENSETETNNLPFASTVFSVFISPSIGYKLNKNMSINFKALYIRNINSTFANNYLIERHLQRYELQVAFRYTL